MSDLNFNSLLTGLVDDHEAPEDTRLKDLAIDEVYEDPDNPRKAFDPDELASLAESVKTLGILQPISVRPRDERGYMIRFGHRRFRAAKMAGLERVRALVTAADVDEADLVASQVVENQHHAALNTQDMIGAVARLLAMGLSQGAAAEKLSIPREQVNMYAGLRELPPTLAPLTGTLGLRALYELNAAWKRDAAKTEALIAEKGDAITVAEARALAADLKPAKRQEPKSPQPAPAPEPAKAEVLHAQQPSEASESAGEGEGVLNVQQGSQGTRTPPPRRPVIVGFDVKIGRRKGRLLLDAGPDPETVMIEFEGGAVEPTPVESVRLTGVRSH